MFRGSETLGSEEGPRTALVTLLSALPSGKGVYLENHTKTNRESPSGWISYGLVFIFQRLIEAKRSIVRPEF